MKITKKDILLIIIFAVIIILITAIGYKFIGANIYTGSAFIVIICIIFFILESYRRLNNHIREVHKDIKRQSIKNYYQIESLFSLFSTLKPDYPLPEMRKWAASPDILKLITQIILSEKPKLIVEASSGVSTLVIAHCLKILGSGKVISLEHDESRAEITRRNISLHKLDNIATIESCPLVKYNIQNREHLWYDLNNINIEDKLIDLLVVDGPPASTQYMARYPALPLLFDKMNNSAVLLLDDGIREDEIRIVDRWKDEFQEVTDKYIELEKGAFYIRINKINIQ